MLKFSVLAYKYVLFSIKYKIKLQLMVMNQSVGQIYM